MNWYKQVKFAASPKNLVIKYKLNPKDDAMLIFWIYQNANNPNIPWKEFKDKDDINNFINSVLIKNLLDTKLNPEEEGSHYIGLEEGKKILEREIANANPHNQEMRQAIQLYRQDPAAAVHQIVDSINENKSNSFSTWIDYLTNQYKEYPSFIYILLNAVADSSPSSTMMEAMPANSLAIANLFDNIQRNPIKYSGAKIIKIYKKEVESIDEAKSGHLSIPDEKGNRWRLIPSKEKSYQDAQTYGTFSENKEILKHYGNLGQWCIGGESWADTYLSAGDFYIYLVNGQPKVAIRSEGDRILEIRGRNNNPDQLLLYWQDIQKFLKENSWEEDAKYASGYEEIAEIIEMNEDFATKSEKRQKILDGIMNGNLRLYSRLTEENKEGAAREYAKAVVSDFVDGLHGELIRGRQEGEGEEEGLFVWDPSSFHSLMDKLKIVPKSLEDEYVLNQVISIIGNSLQGELSYDTPLYYFCLDYMMSEVPPVIRKYFQAEEKRYFPQAMEIYLTDEFKYKYENIDKLKERFHPDFYNLMISKAKGVILSLISQGILTDFDRYYGNCDKISSLYKDGQSIGIEEKELNDAFIEGVKQRIQKYDLITTEYPEIDVVTYFVDILKSFVGHSKLLDDPHIFNMIYSFIQKIAPNIKQLVESKGTQQMNFLLTNLSYFANKTFRDKLKEATKHFEDMINSGDTPQERREAQEKLLAKTKELDKQNDAGLFDTNAKKMFNFFMSEDMKRTITIGVIEDFERLKKYYNERNMISFSAKNFIISPVIKYYMPEITEDPAYQKALLDLNIEALNAHLHERTHMSIISEIYKYAPSYVKSNPEFRNILLASIKKSLEASIDNARYMDKNMLLENNDIFEVYKSILIDNLKKDITYLRVFKDYPLFGRIIDSVSDELIPYKKQYIDTVMAEIEHNHDLLLNISNYSNALDIDKQYAGKRLSEIANNALQYDPELYNKLEGSWMISAHIEWDPEMVEKYVKPHLINKMKKQFYDAKMQFHGYNSLNPPSQSQIKQFPELKQLWITEGIEGIKHNPLYALNYVISFCFGGFTGGRDEDIWCKLYEAVRRDPEFESVIIPKVAVTLREHPEFYRENVSVPFAEFLEGFPLLQQTMNDYVVPYYREKIKADPQFYVPPRIQNSSVFQQIVDRQAKGRGWYKRAISFSLPEKICDIILSENITNVSDAVFQNISPIEFNDALATGIQMAFRKLPEQKFTPNHRMVILALRQFLSANFQPQMQPEVLPIEEEKGQNPENLENKENIIMAKKKKRVDYTRRPILRKDQVGDGECVYDEMGPGPGRGRRRRRVKPYNRKRQMTRGRQLRNRGK